MLVSMRLPGSAFAPLGVFCSACLSSPGLGCRCGPASAPGSGPPAAGQTDLPGGLPHTTDLAHPDVRPARAPLSSLPGPLPLCFLSALSRSFQFWGLHSTDWSLISLTSVSLVMLFPFTTFFSLPLMCSKLIFFKELFLCETFQELFP